MRESCGTHWGLLRDRQGLLRDRQGNNRDFGVSSIFLFFFLALSVSFFLGGGRLLKFLNPFKILAPLRILIFHFEFNGNSENEQFKVQL